MIERKQRKYTSLYSVREFNFIKMILKTNIPKPRVRPKEVCYMCAGLGQMHGDKGKTCTVCRGEGFTGLSD